MKCSICEKEAVGFFVTRTYLVFNSPKIIEARCKDHLNYRNYKWRKKKIFKTREKGIAFKIRKRKKGIFDEIEDILRRLNDL